METESAKAAAAFSKQAPVFDRLNEANPISLHLREQFRKEVLAHLKPASSILELNCGTGLDAIYFSEKGHSVLATDIASGMLDILRNKLKNSDKSNQVEVQQLSFHELNKLQGRKSDHIISNFGGLNCSPDLKSVLSQLSPLLNIGGKVTLMIMPRVSPWELLLALKGKFRTAFRRLKGSAQAHIEGNYFTCYYYGPSYVKRALGSDFKTLSLKGVCVAVPPEFYIGFAERYPRTFRFLKKLELSICGYFPFNRCCDHFLITLQKKND